MSALLLTEHYDTNDYWTNNFFFKFNNNFSFLYVIDARIVPLKIFPELIFCQKSAQV